MRLQMREVTHVQTTSLETEWVIFVLELSWSQVCSNKRARLAIFPGVLPGRKSYVKSSTEEQPRSDEFIFFSHQRYRGRDHDLRPYDQHQQGAMGPQNIKIHQTIFDGKKLSF